MQVHDNPAAYIHTAIDNKRACQMNGEQRSIALYFHPFHPVSDGQNLNNVEQQNYPTEHVVD